MKGNHSRNYVSIITLDTIISFVNQTLYPNSFGIIPRIVLGPGGGETGSREVMVQTMNLAYT